tara:strand:+ start:3905 stop:5602 length:1698 start_codon:yes stop_codon:yes gene_type:complete
MDKAVLKKLKTAVEASRKDLKPYRTQEEKALKQYLGGHYGSDGSDESFPVNMLEIAVSTLLQQLAAQEPQVLVLSRSHRDDVKIVEAAINQRLRDMDFGEELRRFVMSALFSIGVMKVGLEETYRAEVDDESLADTDVFAQHVPFSDWVHDTSAKRWTTREVQFCGHKYRVPIEWVKNNKNFDSEARDAVAEEQDLENGFTTNEFVPYVDLWDIWLPAEHRMVTFHKDGKKALASREVGRKGKYSPFHLLAFNPVLNKVMPLPPVMNWLDAHDLDNRMFVKLGEQASRQKTVTYAAPQSVDDAKKIIKSNDGDTVLVANPQGVREARFGGPDQQILGFAGYMREMTSYVMGNLDSMAGLGSQAGTATQESIIKGSSNARIQAMQSQVLKSVRSIVNDIFHWTWESPLLQMRVTQTVEGTDVTYEADWPMTFDIYGREVDLREGKRAEEFDIDLEPYSMQYKTPSQRLQELRMIWQQDIAPLMQAGLVQADMVKYMRMLSKYGDWPELESILQMAEQSATPVRGRAPANTTREYIRKSEGSQKTMQGTERSLMQQAMSMGNPGQEG